MDPAWGEVLSGLVLGLLSLRNLLMTHLGKLRTTDGGRALSNALFIISFLIFNDKCVFNLPQGVQ